MNILLLGSGGREVAIAKKLCESNIMLYYASYNSNFQLDEMCYEHISYTDINKIIKNCFELKIDYVVIGSEKFLGEYADILTRKGIKVIGPTKSFILESSKIYTRKLIENINNNFNPKFYLNEMGDIDKNSFVIKPDGLTGGKGVKLYPDHFNNYDDAVNYINSLDNYLIEERLYGEEFSLMAFCDGDTLKFMPIVQDYKRAYIDDKGPNTGSMGSVSNSDHKLFFLTDEDIIKCQDLMNLTIYQIKNDSSYQGILYGSFMKTYDGQLKLIEYNCRFGDPEAINVLSLLKTPLHLIFKAIIEKKLNQVNIQWDNLSTVLRYVVPKNYPNETDTYQFKLNNFNNIYLASIKTEYGWVSHANVLSYFTTTKSRSYAICIKGNSIEDCVKELDQYNIPANMYIRSDIGLNYLRKSYSYVYKRDGGVDTNQVGHRLEQCKKMITSTYNKNVTSAFGEFGGNFKYGKNELIASTDGVGTKIILLEKVFGDQGYEIAGQDLVNHNINDILVNGGSPLFFLNYYGCHNFDEKKFHYFIKGVAKSCQKYNIPIIGGETAIMTDVYKEDKTDLIGTIIGEKKIYFSNNFCSDDLLFGIPSSGFHTNGFSIIRKIYDDSMLEGIIQPHQCYLDLIKKLSNMFEIKGICHITGGGFYDNLDRVLGKNNYVLDDFEFPEYYQDILTHYSKEECKNIFNCGIGLIIICDVRYKDVMDIAVKNNTVIGKVLRDKLSNLNNNLV